MGQHISTIGTWLSVVWRGEHCGPGDTFKVLVSIKINSQQPQQVRKVERWESCIILCVWAKHVYHIMMTVIKYSLYWLELKMGVLGFWSDNSSNRTRWKVQIQKGTELLRPHQFSWIGSGNSCTTGPGDWVFWGEACSRSPGRGAGGNNGLSSRPSEPPTNKKYIFSCFMLSKL